MSYEDTVLGASHLKWVKTNKDDGETGKAAIATVMQSDSGPWMRDPWTSDLVWAPPQSEQHDCPGQQARHRTFST